MYDYGWGVLQVGDDGMKQVEDEALMGLKGAAGMDTSREAMHQVLGYERDLILARWSSRPLLCCLLSKTDAVPAAMCKADCLVLFVLANSSPSKT